MTDDRDQSGRRPRIDLDSDDTPIDVPAQVAADLDRRSGRHRPLSATERVGRGSLIQDGDARAVRGRSRTATPARGNAPLDLGVPEVGAVPFEASDEVTDVHKLVAKVASAMDAEEFSPSQIRLTEAIIGVVWGHVHSAEKRRGTGDMKVLAASGGEDVGARIGALEGELHDIHSELQDIRGTRPARANGKIGDLRKDVAEVQGSYKSLRNGLIALLVAVGGAAGGAAKLIDDAAERRGNERAEFQHLREAVEVLNERQDAIRVEWPLIKMRLGLSVLPPAVPGDVP